jgi:hypothetical protein
VWYIGGQLSEDGVPRGRDEQIQAARRELRECLPWLPWDRAALEWTTFHIDRAEGLTANASRPDEPVVKQIENMIVAWPTKLAFAPAAAERITSLLKNDDITPGSVAPPEESAPALAGLPRPPLGEPPWNDRSGRLTWTS